MTKAAKAWNDYFQAKYFRWFNGTDKARSMELGRDAFEAGWKAAQKDNGK